MEDELLNIDELTTATGEENTSPKEFSFEDFIPEEKRESFFQGLEQKFGTKDLFSLVENNNNAKGRIVELEERLGQTPKIHPYLEKLNPLLDGLDPTAAAAKINAIQSVSNIEKLEGEDLARKYLQMTNPTFSNEEIENLLIGKIYGGSRAEEGNDVKAVQNKAALMEFNKTAKSELLKLKQDIESVKPSTDIAAQERELALQGKFASYSDVLVKDKIEVAGISFDVNKEDYTNVVANQLLAEYKKNASFFARGNATKVAEMAKDLQTRLFMAQNYEQVIAKVQEDSKAKITREDLKSRASGTRVKSQSLLRKQFGIE